MLRVRSGVPYVYYFADPLSGGWLFLHLLSRVLFLFSGREKLMFSEKFLSMPRSPS